MFPKGKNASDWKKACDGVMGILSTMGYSLGTLANYSGVYKNLLSFLFQRKLTDKPVDKKHTDAFFRYFDDTPHSYVTKKLYQGALRRLLEFHQSGTFGLIQKPTITVLLPASYESILTKYQKYRIAEIASTAELSERHHLSVIREFLHCLHNRRITLLRRIRFDDVQAFLKVNSKLSPSSIAYKACAVRSFFRFLIATKMGSPALLGFIPSIRNSRTFRLAAIWPQADVKKLLSAIDRKTDLGKRNYAIILLVARTGIRIGEALNLKIENIDWRKSTLHITQPKTKNILELPMSEDIGNALIDYLVNGRPSVLSRHVFVMHRAPYREYKANRGFPNILAKYRKKAGVISSQTSNHNWHSLRHSLATRLHEEKTPLPVIAAILGHSSLETTRIYTRSNIEMLRQAALEWEEFRDEQ